ncbi:MAG TPA: class I SAM-dependent methyltransferase [Solirubrobacteraceae bacterium]
MSTGFEAEQRLAFGRVAELYDRARPSYPGAAIDAVIGHAGLVPPARILEIGAGTGKATALFAARGLGVVALEPSHEMAAVARSNCSGYRDVEVVEAQFEDWRPAGRFPAAVSVQAWHWLDPELRYGLAREALETGGTLAAIWTLPDWEHSDSRQALSEAYAAAAPQLAADFPMHPDSRPTRLAGDWRAEIERSPGFTAPGVEVYPWSQRYSTADYLALLQTHQDHILLEPGSRAGLLAAIGRAIDERGGALVMRFVTRVCLATRS